MTVRDLSHNGRLHTRTARGLSDLLHVRGSTLRTLSLNLFQTRISDGFLNGCPSLQLRSIELYAGSIEFGPESK